MNEVTGKVAKVDRSKKEITLALKVSDSTQVTKDGKSASLSDIKEGDQVRASFSGSGDTLQVTQIEVLSKGATTPGSKKSATPGSSSSSGMGGTAAPSEPSGTSAPGSSTSPGSSGSSSTPGSSQNKGY